MSENILISRCAQTVFTQNDFKEKIVRLEKITRRIDGRIRRGIVAPEFRRQHHPWIQHYCSRMPPPTRKLLTQLASAAAEELSPFIPDDPTRSAGLLPAPPDRLLSCRASRHPEPRPARACAHGGHDPSAAVRDLSWQSRSPTARAPGRRSTLTARRVRRRQARPDLAKSTPHDPGPEPRWAQPDDPAQSTHRQAGEGLGRMDPCPGRRPRRTAVQNTAKEGARIGHPT